MQKPILVRPAVASDMPAIHALVYELAVYEKAPEAVVTTPEVYLKDFQNGRFESIVAEVAGTVAGMVLFYPAYSTWKGNMLYLEDFVVSEPYRGLGIGQLLYDAFVEEGRKRGCSLVKWQVLDWNTPALRFYEKNDAIVEKDWWNCKVFLPH